MNAHKIFFIVITIGIITPIGGSQSNKLKRGSSNGILKTATPLSQLQDLWKHGLPVMKLPISRKSPQPDNPPLTRKSDTVNQPDPEKEQKAKRHESARRPLQDIFNLAHNTGITLIDYLNNAHNTYASVATPEEMQEILQLQAAAAQLDTLTIGANVALINEDFPTGTKARQTLQDVQDLSNQIQTNFDALTAVLENKLRAKRQEEFTDARLSPALSSELSPTLSPVNSLTESPSPELSV